MRYVREGWPSKNVETNDKVNKFRKLSDSLSTCHGCLIHGSRVVIPQSLQSKVLDLLHPGHFGMERMKQLARTAVYWAGIDAAIEMASRRCYSCGEHQNKPSKPPLHPWMLPEKPWGRLHLDHAINFMGKDWLVITDAYSKCCELHSPNRLSCTCSCVFCSYCRRYVVLAAKNCVVTSLWMGQCICGCLVLLCLLEWLYFGC